MPRIETHIRKETEALRLKGGLDLLQQADPNITNVIERAMFVSVYVLNESEQKWSRAEIEGPLYIVYRWLEPHYRLVILNQRDPQNLVEDITPLWEVSAEDNYIFFRVPLNPAVEPYPVDPKDRRVAGLWFSDDTERVAVQSAIDSILSTLLNETTTHRTEGLNDSASTVKPISTHMDEVPNTTTASVSQYEAQSGDTSTVPSSSTTGVNERVRRYDHPTHLSTPANAGADRSDGRVAGQAILSLIGVHRPTPVPVSPQPLKEDEGNGTLHSSLRTGSDPPQKQPNWPAISLLTTDPEPALQNVSAADAQALQSIQDSFFKRKLSLSSQSFSSCSPDAVAPRSRATASPLWPATDDQKAKPRTRRGLQARMGQQQQQQQQHTLPSQEQVLESFTRPRHTESVNMDQPFDKCKRTVYQRSCLKESKWIHVDAATTGKNRFGLSTTAVQQLAYIAPLCNGSAGLSSYPPSSCTIAYNHGPHCNSTNSCMPNGRPATHSYWKEDDNLSSNAFCLEHSGSAHNIRTIRTRDPDVLLARHQRRMAAGSNATTPLGLKDTTLLLPFNQEHCIPEDQQCSCRFSTTAGLSHGSSSDHAVRQPVCCRHHNIPSPHCDLEQRLLLTLLARLVQPQCHILCHHPSALGSNLCNDQCELFQHTTRSLRLCCGVSDGCYASCTRPTPSQLRSGTRGLGFADQYLDQEQRLHTPTASHGRSGSNVATRSSLHESGSCPLQPTDTTPSSGRSNTMCSH